MNNITGKAVEEFDHRQLICAMGVIDAAHDNDPILRDHYGRKLFHLTDGKIDTAPLYREANRLLKEIEKCGN